LILIDFFGIIIIKTILIYPPHYNYKLKDINFIFDIKKLEVIGPLIKRNNKYWNGLYNQIDMCFKNKKALLKGFFYIDAQQIKIQI
jgi:hypothetical protein